MARFRVRSWNCFGMGQGVLDAITALRAPVPERLRHGDVHEACAVPNVLCVQELLSRDAQQFFDGVGNETFVARFRDHNRPSFRPASMRGSGLGIASRSPLLEPRVRHYLPPNVGWDKLARKGSLHVQIPLAGGPTVDLLTTHLQAGYDPGAIAVRAAQLAELAEVVREVGHDDRPFIVCGDFNIDGLASRRDAPEYRRLVSALEGFVDLGAEDDRATYEPHPDTNALAYAYEPDGPRMRIDYVFFRQAKNGRPLASVALERILDRPLTSPAGAAPAYASDHFGLCASFEYEPARP